MRTFSKPRYEGTNLKNRILISALPSVRKNKATEKSEYVPFNKEDIYDANINMFVIPYVYFFFLDFFFWILLYN